MITLHSWTELSLFLPSHLIIFLCEVSRFTVTDNTRRLFSQPLRLNLAFLSGLSRSPNPRAYLNIMPAPTLEQSIQFAIWWDSSSSSYRMSHVALCTHACHTLLCFILPLNLSAKDRPSSLKTGIQQPLVRCLVEADG